MTTSNEHNNAPAVPDGLQWFTVAEHGIPEIGAEVIGGLWYTDPWIKTEFATTFMWGQCRVVESKHRDFKDGKQWCTFGPSHNQITHWARINTPGQTSAPAPAVPQGEPVAWMVYGNYTRQPFGMLSSAEAYMRGLLKSDPDGGYHIRPLRYATPAAPEQTVPSVVWIVSNKTSSTVFATEEFAQKFISSFSGSVAGGFSVSRVDVIGARQPATDAGVMAQGVGLTDEEIEAIAKKHMSTVGDHWSNEEAIREIHAEDFARDIIAALRAKESK